MRTIDVNAHDRCHETALQAASAKGNEKIVQILLKNSAANAQSASGTRLQKRKRRSWDG